MNDIAAIWSKWRTHPLKDKRGTHTNNNHNKAVKTHASANYCTSKYIHIWSVCVCVCVCVCEVFTICWTQVQPLRKPLQCTPNYYTHVQCRHVNSWFVWKFHSNSDNLTWVPLSEYPWPSEILWHPWQLGTWCAYTGHPSIVIHTMLVCSHTLL